jgi:ankyrin repeat protein
LDLDGLAPLHIAVSKNNLQQVKTLLRHSANPNIAVKSSKPEDGKVTSY